MKRNIVICLVASLMLVGCGSNKVVDKEIILETQDVQSSINATETPVTPVDEEKVVNDTITISSDELEKLINEKVEERFNELFDERLADIPVINGKDGKDGRDGIDGKDGIGLAGLSVDGNGDLVVALSNGTVASVGHIKGEKGDKGDKGDSGADGKDGKDGTVIADRSPDFIFNNGGQGTELISYIGGSDVVEIPDKCTKILSNAFSDNKVIKKVIIPDGVTEIGDGAFNTCIKLEDINLPTNLTTIGSNAFARCPIDIELPQKLQSIGDSAFANTNITNIEFPNSLTYIGDYAFGYCKNITSIELPDSLSYIGKGTFQLCEKLTSVKFPSNIKVIPESMFYGCESLSDITIPSTVTDIETSAFSHTNLSTIIIPNSVIRIGGGAFSGGPGNHMTGDTITKIIMSDNIQNIGDDPFGFQYNISVVSYKGVDYPVNYEKADALYQAFRDNDVEFTSLFFCP